MKQIEEVYKGLGRYGFGDIEFILCHSPSDKESEDLPRRYICGEISRGKHPILNFRVPVIRTGEVPNVDGFYKLEQAICRYENDKVIVERLENVTDNGVSARVNVDERRIFVLCKACGISDALMDPLNLRRVNSNVYITSWLWVYPIQ